MATKQGKRSLVVALSILGVLLVVIGAVALIRIMDSYRHDPYKQNTSNTSDTSSSQDSQSTQTEKQSEDSSNSSSTPSQQPELDPTTVATIDIVPMTITVSYVKGVGGFEYQVLRANNGTRYVEFSSAELVGTKCTNDVGIFASIIENPTENENTALAKTTIVDDVKYGLSLADATCTSNPSALQEYQKSFSDAFSLLKRID